MLAWLLLVLVLLPTLSHGVTHLAIHATDIERAQWQTRAVSGPYKSDWDRIKDRADSFRTSPSARWLGNTTSRCYGSEGTNITISRTQDEGLRDAAFVY